MSPTSHITVTESWQLTQRQETPKTPTPVENLIISHKLISGVKMKILHYYQFQMWKINIVLGKIGETLAVCLSSAFLVCLKSIAKSTVIFLNIKLTNRSKTQTTTTQKVCTQH